MKSILGQGAVQASDGLSANGGILGALVGGYQKRKELEMKYQYNTALMDYQHAQDKEMAIHKTAAKITGDMAGSAIQNHFDTLFEGTKTKEEKKRVGAKAGAEIAVKRQGELATQGTIAARHTQERKTANNAARIARKNKEHGVKTDLQGLEGISAGLNSGKISPFIGGFGGYSAQNVGNRLPADLIPGAKKTDTTKADKAGGSNARAAGKSGKPTNTGKPKPGSGPTPSPKPAPKPGPKPAPKIAAETTKDTTTPAKVTKSKVTKPKVTKAAGGQA